MSVAPKLRRLVMFKHGVAYVERSGRVDGAFELRVRRGEVNDVLKSLTAVVIDGKARVGAVTFDSADDPSEELAARNLLPGRGETLATVIAAVRGRRVIADDGSKHEGEVLGVEATPMGDGAWRTQIVLRATDGAITLVDLAALRRLELLDPSSRADVDLLVDKSRAMTAGDARRKERVPPSSASAASSSSTALPTRSRSAAAARPWCPSPRPGSPPARTSS